MCSLFAISTQEYSTANATLARTHSLVYLQASPHTGSGNLTQVMNVCFFTNENFLVC